MLYYGITAGMVGLTVFCLLSPRIKVLIAFFVMTSCFDLASKILFKNFAMRQSGYHGKPITGTSFGAGQGTSPKARLLMHSQCFCLTPEHYELPGCRTRWSVTRVIGD
jgi:hypothetical protein